MLFRSSGKVAYESAVRAPDATLRACIRQGSPGVRSAVLRTYRERFGVRVPDSPDQAGAAARSLPPPR